jgi:hypothetical protein
VFEQRAAPIDSCVEPAIPLGIGATTADRSRRVSREKVVLRRTTATRPAGRRRCCTVQTPDRPAPSDFVSSTRESMTSSDETTIWIAASHAAAADALEAAGVRSCRLRGTRGGAEDDRLVEPGRMDVVDRAMAAAGFALVRRRGRGSHRAYHAVDPVTGAWAKVDLVTRIDLGPYQEVRTGLADGFLDRAKNPTADPPGASDLDPDDAFWAVLLHELWDRPAPAIRRPDELRALADAARPDGPAAMAIRPILPADMDPAWVIDRARSGDVGSLVRLGRRMRARPRPSVRFRQVAARVTRWLDRHDPPFLRRGVSVALLGPDGTGKSMLSGRLLPDGPLEVRTVYLGLYGGQRDGRGGRRIPGLGFVRRLSRMWRGWLIGRMHVARGRIVVFDRHPIEARTSLGTGRRAPLGRRLLARSIPSADVIVVLDAPGSVLYARKPEHPVDRLEAQRTAYRGLAGRLPGATLVDVDRPADAVVHEVSAIVWRHVAERGRRR